MARWVSIVGQLARRLEVTRTGSTAPERTAMHASFTDENTVVMFVGTMERRVIMAFVCVYHNI